MRRRAQFPDRAKSGVYLIKESGVIVYVGYSGYDVYKTMYRHFQEWNHQTQDVVTYNADNGNYTVRVIYCTPQQAAALELALIKRHNPRDNADKYNAVQLDAKAKRALESYKETEPEAPQFSARELKVMEEDKAYFEELKAGGAAIFGDENTYLQKRINKIYKTWQGIRYYSQYEPTEEGYIFWESDTHPKYKHFTKQTRHK